jgi:hypothetical protein
MVLENFSVLSIYYRSRVKIKPKAILLSDSHNKVCSL